MPRTHVRSHFYKLSTRAVAKIIIEHRTIRWRTPLQFNDPFDTQTRLTANVDPDKYVDRFMQRLDELAFASDVPPYYDPDNSLTQAAMVMRNTTALQQRREALEFRSDESRVGKECVTTGSYRWSPSHKKIHTKQ